MRRESKKNCLAKGLAGILCALILGLFFCQPIFAARLEAWTDCSLTLLLGEGETHTQNPLQGGKIALYFVAGVSSSANGSGVDDQGREQKAGYLTGGAAYDVSAGQFAGSEALAGLEGFTKEELDAKNASIAEALLREVGALSVQPLQTANIANGRVSFTGLSTGLYLLTQTEDSEDGRRLHPFLLSIPDAKGAYDVVAAPKLGFSTPSFTPTPTLPPNIPQTGQLWWPVPVLGILGLDFLALGLVLRKK